MSKFFQTVLNFKSPQVAHMVLDCDFTPKFKQELTLAEMGNRLAIDMAEKWGLLCPSPWGAGPPSNTMWPGPRPTAVPSGILIYPTVWSQ